MASSKHRQPRLRASCDGCFIAKVKCSKSRPICSRCLSCGIECRYSPSSRAGKPKADGSGNHGHGHGHGHSSHHSPASNSGPHHHHNAAPVADMAAMAAAAGFSSIISDNGILYTTTAVPGMTGWQSPHPPPPPPVGGMDGAAAAGAATNASELAFLAATDENAASSHHGEMYGISIPWTPPADMSMAQFADASLGGLPMTPQVGYSMAADVVSDGMPWTDACAVEYFPYSSNSNSQHQMPTPASSSASPNTYFPSPSTTPNNSRHSPSSSGHKQVPPRHASSASASTSASSSSSRGSRSHTRNSSSSYYYYHGDFQEGTCTCFASCLQSLQALHNASTPDAPPSFDVVLALNRSAVDGCSAMLSCARCMSRSGTHTAAMLLATVIGKVTSFYKHASLSYFTSSESSSSLESSLDSIVGGGGGLDMGSAVAVADGSAASATHPSVSSPQPHAAAALTGLGVSLGAYHLQGEEGRWFELEILNRELKKLEDVYSRFREVCAELSEDVEVSKAMIGYLGHTLGSTLSMVSHSKDEARFM